MIARSHGRSYSSISFNSCCYTFLGEAVFFDETILKEIEEHPEKSFWGRPTKVGGGGMTFQEKKRDIFGQEPRRVRVSF